jgi:gamma-glutamyltranspeptidase/glutathione hydrolase
MMRRITYSFLIFILSVSFQGYAYAFESYPATDSSPSTKLSLPSAIASAHPLATQAGLEILSQGGNAFDAAIAVTATLAVVEPYSSGIGGGGFYLLHQVEGDNYVMLDARERAPLNANKDLYLNDKGEVIAGASIKGALSAGIPGIPEALVHLAENYGKLKLAQSLAPAILHAEQGFIVDEYYQRMASFRLSDLQENKAASDIFLQDGKLPEIGYNIVQKDLANTLRLIAGSGRPGFYEKEFALRLVKDVQKNGGIWTIDDLTAYSVKERSPTVASYKGMKLTAASLPSSGGIVLSEILGILAEFELEKMSRAQRIHHIAEAMRRAYRDRAEFMGDSDYVDVPIEYLTSEKYIRSLAASISSKHSTPSLSLRAVAQPSGKGADTTHFSILDGDGNKVSATLSINYPFGSCYVAEGTGVLLNDEMDDFVSKPGVPNAYGLVGASANAIEPGKRMLSSMTPSIVETDDRIGIIGTPGGSRIITMILLSILDFYAGDTAEEIVNAGRYHHQYLPDEISYEPGVFDSALLEALADLGHRTRALDHEYGNMHAIIIDKQAGDVNAASDKRGVGSASVVQ